MGKKKELIDKKIILLGDTATGKTTLLKNIKNGSNYITEQLMSNKFELRAKNQKSKTYTRITLWDGIVSGYKTDYRPIAYKNTDLIILFYSIDSFNTYNGIKSRWIPEIKTFANDVPLILIGNKSDKRDRDDCQKTVSTEDGAQLAKEIKAKGFLECCSFEENCLHELVQTLLDNFTLKNSQKTKECTIM